MWNSKKKIEPLERMQKTVLHNQSFIDFVLHHTGSLEDALKIASANQMSLTDKLVPGTLLVLPDNSAIDTTIRDYFYDKNWVPATGFPKTSDSVQPYPDPDFNFPPILPYVF